MNLKNFFKKKIWFTKKLNFYWPVSAISIFLTLIWLLVSCIFIYQQLSNEVLFWSNYYGRWQFIALPESFLIFLIFGQWFARWKMKVKSISYVLILFTFILFSQLIVSLVYVYNDYDKLRNNKSAPVDQAIVDLLLLSPGGDSPITVDSWDSKYGRIYHALGFPNGSRYYDYLGNLLVDCGGYDGGYYPGDRSCYFLDNLDTKKADYHQDSEWWQEWQKKHDNLLKQ
jgi:hypothetical protein